MGRARFEAEFGVYADWLVDAIERTGVRDLVPVACRGTANPALLEHLAAPLDVGAGSLVLDIGVGLGGPGAWLVRRSSCRLVGIDIMVQTTRGARRLFGDIRVAVASTGALPFRDRTFDAAWALGVIEMLADKERAFREILRVLAPGGRVVLYDFVATEPRIEGSPAACRFESASDITGKLEKAGLRVLRTESVPAMSPPPEDWRTAIAEVRGRVHSEHGGDRRLEEAERERDNFNRLRRSGSITEWEFLAESPAS